MAYVFTDQAGITKRISDTQSCFIVMPISERCKKKIIHSTELDPPLDNTDIATVRLSF